ncbi:putative disease resistance protein RGA4 [Macadamia integrifolia]|uniref:putative disease resistance protein RGA4 n=1 Tax=Macadamia integrifolia TaxID=60698 RepID=UPI001C532A64|nr:putative disease resistance protein RGA4 [Macadamia integrifolia]
MVDAVILRVVLQNINSLLQEEFGLVWGVDREMRRLSNTLATIRDVLEDAEMKQFKDKAIKGWLKKLKDAAYDADDILDECAAKALQLEEAQKRNCANQVSNSFLPWFNFEKLMFRRKIGQRIKDIRERFDDIADERSKFHLNPRGNAMEWTVETSERETSSILTESHVYGRDEDKEKIVKVLMDNISNPELLVYPIIGITGLSILAALRVSYNHLPSHLRQCFAYCSIFPKDYRMWKKPLIYLWMANDFVPSKGKMELEDTGNEIFNELVWRSFFQDIEKDGDGNVVNCKMHDLVHDLACSVMDNECLALETRNEKTVPKGAAIFSSLFDTLEAFDTLEVPSPNNDQTHIQENVDEVVEGLQPPTSIKRLKMEGYQGMKFPRWMEDLSLQNLVDVELKDCSRCENFPPLGNLPFLKFLHVSGMDSVRYLLDVESDSGDGSAKGFPLLEVLKLYNMLNLEELLLNVTRGREVVVFPCLVSMRIMNCDKLKTLPLLPSLKSLFLQTKESENIPEGLLQNRNLPVLESLNFDNSPNLVNLPRLSIRHGEYGFSSLKEFRVNECNAMKYLWEDETQFQGLCSLKVLIIECCERLVSLPRIRYLTALEHLYINQCPELELSQLEDFRHLTSLQKIDIINLPKLMTLAESLRHTTTLQHLRITGCVGLTVLPELIENLTSLRTIEIWYCPNLTFLPDALRQLTMLQTLIIEGCPVLETRCREGREDWQKISHIPKVIISSWPPRTPMKQNRGCWGRLLELKRRCGAMKSLWKDETQFKGLSYLKALMIYYCDKLETLSGLRYVTALEKLIIYDCRKLELSKLEDFRHLTSLQEIEIVNMCESISRPENLKHTTMLQRLHISCCMGLTALPEWIHNLTSLRIIEICGCPNLCFLPDGFQHMTALQTLIIDNCPVLETRYREGGENWHKISHIPNVIFRSWPSPVPMRQNRRCWDRLLKSRRRR